jgi:hypothetical protein
MVSTNMVVSMKEALPVGGLFCFGKPEERLGANVIRLSWINFPKLSGLNADLSPGLSPTKSRARGFNDGYSTGRGVSNEIRANFLGFKFSAF